MKRPKRFWIIHLGSSETQLSGKRIFCQWLLKPCCKSYWDHLSSRWSNCKKTHFGFALRELSRWGVPSPEHLWCKTRNEVVRDTRVWLTWQRWQMLANTTTCQQKIFLDWEIMRRLPIWVDRQHLQPAVPLLQIRDGGLVCVLSAETEAAIMAVLWEPDGTVS